MDNVLHLDQSGQNESDDPAVIAQREALDKIGMTLEKSKDEAVRWKAQFEQRFIEADMLYQFGMIEVPDTKDFRQKVGDEHRQNPDNIVRTKTVTIAARLSDMLFPTNDLSFAIAPTPVPQFSPLAQAAFQQLQQTGQLPAELDDSAISDLAKFSAARMQQRIKDALDECDYTAQGRRAIDYGCKLGTGVLCGPFPRIVTKRATASIGFAPMGQVAPGGDVKTEKLAPTVECVDPRDFFPQPARRVEECGHAWRLRLMTDKQVRALDGQPSFNPDQIKRLLAAKPDLGVLSERPLFKDGDGMAQTIIMAGRYPVWEYVGPVDRECLGYFGVELPPDDTLTVYDGCIWMSQGIVLRASLMGVQGEDRIGYYVWNYEEDPNSIFGWGVPHILKHDQITANMGWSAATLVTMASAYPQIALGKGLLEPDADGTNKFPRFKPWVLNTDDINKAIQFAVIPNTSAGALELYDRAKQNAEEHSMMPLIAQGEPSQVQQTASGMAMLMNASNIVPRKAAKSWDDNVTVPLIRAMVDYDLIYGDDPLAKADFDVVPRASSHLLVKDVQLQHAMALLQMADNPENAAIFKREKLIRNIVGYLDMQENELLNTPEDVAKAQEAAAQNQPQDPRIEAEKIRQETAKMEIEARTQQIQIQGQIDLSLAEQRTVQEQIRAAAATQDRQDDNAAKLAMTEVKERAATVRDELRAGLALQAELNRDEREREKNAADVAIKAKQLVTQQQRTAASLMPQNPS